MLVVSAVAVFVGIYRLSGGEWRFARVFQVGRVVVVQGEPLPEVVGHLALWVKGGQAGGAGLLPGAGMLVVGDVERFHSLAGEEEAVLASFGHTPHDGLNPAAGAQPSQHGPYPVLGHIRRGSQVGHAGQRHLGVDSQQSSLFLAQWLPGRHRYPSFVNDPPNTPEPVYPTCVQPYRAAH